jgi:cell division protein FtsZ
MGRDDKPVSIKVANTPSAPEKPARPAPQPAPRADRDEADLLEIPAFLRRQAN